MLSRYMQTLKPRRSLEIIKEEDEGGGEAVQYM